MIEDKLNVIARELKIQGFNLFMLMRRLAVIIRNGKSQFSIILFISQAHKDLNARRNFILMEYNFQMLGPYGCKKL